MSDLERARDLARTILGDVATAEIVELLRAAFAEVRQHEHDRLMTDLRTQIRMKRQPVEWAEQAEAGSWG